MAVKRPSTATPNATTNTAAQQAAPVAPQQQQPRQPGQKSLAGINGLYRSPMSRNSYGENVSEYVTKMKEIIAADVSPDLRDHIHVLALDIDSNSLSTNVILIAWKDGDNVAVYCLPIEGEPLDSRNMQFGQSTVQVITVPGDVYDAHLVQVASAHLRNLLGENIVVVDVGACVINRNLKATDHKNLRALVYNAVSGCYSILGRLTGNEPPAITVADIKTTDVLSARMEYNPGSVQTCTGQIVRSDVAVNLKGIINNGDYVSSNQTVPLTNVDAYIDLVYVEPQPQPQPVYGQPMIPASRVQYFPRLILTRMSPAMDAISMEVELLALSTATLMSKDNAWLHCFTPIHGVGGANGTDLRDIGAIGYEVQLSDDLSAPKAKIDTKSNDFDNTALHRLMSTYVAPNLVYSMDVEETGELSWIQGAFINAANGGTEGQASIVRAADVLTNGVFSTIYPGGNPMMEGTVQIHLGSYQGENGQPADIRELDYLAMLNLMGHIDMTVVESYGATYDDLSVDEPLRMERRLNIIRDVLGESVVITGKAQRLTYNPEFVMALTASVQKAGLHIRPEGVFHQAGMATRGSQTIAGAALQGDPSGMFAYQNTPQGVAGNQYYGARRGFWG